MKKYFKNEQGELFYKRHGELFLLHEFKKSLKVIGNKDNFGNLTEISSQRYGEMRNNHFRNKTFRWSYFGEKFKNMKPFESLSEMELLPTHVIETIIDVKMVLFRGEIHYAYIRKGRENVPLKNKLCGGKWFFTSYKNCHPIWNVSKKCFA